MELVRIDAIHDLHLLHVITLQYNVQSVLAAVPLKGTYSYRLSDEECQQSGASCLG